MKQKINRSLVLVALVAMLLATLGITWVYYDLYQQQVRRDLQVAGDMLSATGSSDSLPSLPAETLRVTWISADGSVLYDNDADSQTLANHGDRPEVQSALTRGTGESTRRSDTLNLNTFYYAKRLPDGTVLRLAVEARSMPSVFLAAGPIVLLLAVVIVGICILLSHLLTQQLIAPIEAMAEHLDDAGGQPAYPELYPFAKKIRTQHEKILSAAKSRQDFTANVSHELKTPLTAISGYAELLENQMVPQADQPRLAGEIRENAHRLLSLINDILRLSELDETGSPSQSQHIELLNLCREVCRNMQLQADARQIRLKCFGRECIVTGDREQIKELVENLVQNAIRYNREGGFVQVTVKSSGGKAVLSVEDNGIGIPADSLDRVFERFYRVDKSRSRQTGGTGLGLAIVKHIAQIHSAELKLDSTLGEGTKVTVSF